MCQNRFIFHNSIKLLSRQYLIVTSLFLSLPFGQILAAENWGLCRAPSFQFVDIVDSSQSTTEIQADRLNRDNNDLIRFSGQVELSRAGQNIRAEELIIDNLAERLTANGQVIFEDASFRLQTDALSLDQKTQSAQFGSAKFELPGQHAHGSAAKIFKIDDSRSRFRDILYTSCDPDDRDWHLTASELNIDDETGRGTARHTTLYFQDIPFFYLPYFMFPIDDRRMSGMLTPLISYSDTLGSSLAVPVYWNIAPNTDATITPAWYGKRGLQWNSENRYLSLKHEGQIDLAYLDDDLTGSSRWLKKWQHKADLGLNIKANLLLQEVSDELYFSDFESLTSERDDIDYLERHVSLDHSSDSWQTRLSWQDYQTIDQSIAISSQPYQRLPGLTLNTLLEPLDNGLQFDLRNEWVNFERDSSVTGSRLHIAPSIAWSKADSWYFFEPKLQYALTEYRLDNNGPNANSISRSIPTLSLDTGLIFERIFSARRGLIQTLEPRLFYLNTPFEDQSIIPDFDTALLSESYANFFKTNRFSGFDRIGDADQVTFGLGSRIISTSSGAELLNMSLGQIHYRQDRQVSLDNTTAISPKSNLIAQISMRPSENWQIGSKLVRQQETKNLSEKNLSVNYQKQGFAANIEYFFTDQVLEQSLVSAVYPLNDRWTIVAKYHHSELFDKPVENLFGLSYESCCWGFKILASQTSDDNFIETDRALYFELTLKGLSQIGKDIDTELTSSIPGYQTRF
jgi:LPS-assembly protein